MPAYLITGSPGVGKSTVTLALKDRGFKAYDSESMKDVTRLEYRATGEPAEWPEPPIDWDVYDFVWQEKALRKLLDSGEVVFVGASVGNQDKFYQLFDKIFVLTLDNESLKKRLASRDKSFGKHPDELAGILSYNTERQTRLMATPRAVAIDASRPLDEIVDEIIQHTNSR
jgi:broad-specificity NMP kinase